MAGIKKFFVLEIIIMAILILFSLSFAIGENIYARVDRGIGLQSNTVTNQFENSDSIFPDRHSQTILERTKPTNRQDNTTTRIYHGLPATRSLSNIRFMLPSCLREVGWYYGWHGRTFEYGTDFDCAYHTKIPNLWAGTVVQAERTCWNTSCTSSSGGVVVIYAYVPGLGFEDTYYLHLDIISVKVGETIDKYTPIGYTGGTTYGYNPTSPWFSSGAHLEMGFNAPFLKHDKGENVNPLPYIEAALR